MIFTISLVSIVINARKLKGSRLTSMGCRFITGACPVLIDQFPFQIISNMSNTCNLRLNACFHDQNSYPCPFQFLYNFFRTFKPFLFSDSILHGLTDPSFIVDLSYVFQMPSQYICQLIGLQDNPSTLSINSCVQHIGFFCLYQTVRPSKTQLLDSY